MNLNGLATRARKDLPGVVGAARVQWRSSDLLRRVSPGDIAVVDQPDIDRRTALALATAGVAAVVNAAPSISGRFPNMGPEVLLAAGIPLIDGVPREQLRRIKDGTKIRLHDGIVFCGQKELGRGTVQTAEAVADQMIEARAGMSIQLEAFSANTIEFLRKERMLVLDGVGVPELAVPVEGRHVLVLAPGSEPGGDLRWLRRYVRQYRPVLIGVESGADTLRSMGCRPDVIVGAPDTVTTATLRCGARVVIPAHLDGFAPGLERIQDLGVGAVTFPAAGNPEDLALLLADAHGADLVVTVGFGATLREFLDRGRSGSNPSTFLTRLRLGSKLVDGAAVAALQRGRVPVGAMLVLAASVLFAVLAAVVVSGLGTSYSDLVVDAAQMMLANLEGLLR